MRGWRGETRQRREWQGFGVADRGVGRQGRACRIACEMVEYKGDSLMFVRNTGELCFVHMTSTDGHNDRTLSPNVAWITDAQSHFLRCRFQTVV
jgi:hypothetical protein